MPIVIPRSGQAPPLPEISQEQRDLLWEYIIRAYIKMRPEEVVELAEQK